MKILFHRNFEKNYIKLRISEKNKFKERLNAFVEDPFNPLLSNHALKGKYRAYRSINIGGNLRAVYKTIKNEEYLFVAIGTHAELYGL
jgi:addiction module RelE/StbE family toxin